jgi:ribosomal protein L19E
LVVELNEDEAERMRANSRLYFLMDQQGFRREGEAKGWKEAEAKYRPELEAKDRKIKELLRKLREAGIDS